MYPTLLRCQQACSVPRRSCLGAMLALPRCQQTCSVSRRVYKHFPQLILIFSFVLLPRIVERGDAEKSKYFVIYIYIFFRPHQNFLYCPLSSTRHVLFLKQLAMTGRHPFLVIPLRKRDSVKR
jgi:hypothetical protein